MSMRTTLDAFLQNKPGAGTAFVPLMETLAARIGGIDYQTMCKDPSQWSSNLAKAGQLLEANALILGFDTTLLAEACGAKVNWQNDKPVLLEIEDLASNSNVINGRLEIAIEALGRLCLTERTSFGCIAAMTGPISLAAQLNVIEDKNNHLKQTTVEVAQTLCSKRPDLLLIREGSALCANDIGLPQRKAFNTISNVARYFNIPTAIYLEGYTQNIISKIDKLKMDFYFFGETKNGVAPDPNLFSELAKRVKGIGIALPFADKTEALSHAKLCRTSLAGKNILFTNTGVLDRDTDLDMTRAITTGLRAL